MENLAPGTLGRWAIGIIIINYLMSYNEFGCMSTLIAFSLAFINAVFAVFCKNGLKNIQIPYLRATSKLDFLCLFLSLWMELLALLAACAILSRTISCALDIMTGGWIRIYILGRNSPMNEPWPDVLGVSVVFLVTGMFMMGLENSKIFSILMISGVILISGLVSIATYLRGNLDSWKGDNILPSYTQIISGTALLTCCFPHQLCTRKNPRLKYVILGMVVLISNLLITGCLSTLLQINPPEGQYQAIPLVSILEKKDLHKFIPAIACLYVLACTGALLELFPEAYSIVVRLATSEWKILVRQISYENDFGSPILAVFTVGSLTAILAFASPLQSLTWIMSGSLLASWLLQAFYLLYSPFRPKSTNPQESSSLSYSRLNQSEPKSNTFKKRSFWFLSKAVNSVSTPNLTLSKSKSKINKTGRDEEMEREWLLLGEPPNSPGTAERTFDVEESSIITDINSDVDCIAKADGSESDSSTDIDAIVDEYRQKLIIKTSGLKESNLRVPTTGSWRFAILCVISILLFLIVSTIHLLSGIIGSFIVIIIMYFIPKYQSISLILPAISLIFNSVLISYTKLESWLAVSFWFLSGIILFIRCDTWCCLCLDGRVTENGTDDMHQILTSTASNSKLATTIRLQNPPKGTLIKQNVVDSYYHSRR